MEDLILNKNKVKIGSREIVLSLPSGNGAYFDKSDINEFGYPNAVKSQAGEFRYWAPNGNKRAVVRNRLSELDLNCIWEPSVSVGWVGVRRAKFFP